MDEKVHRLPRNLDRPVMRAGWSDADLAALREQGMTGGMVVADAPQLPVVEWRHGEVNPEPIEGEFYWVWCRDAQQSWRPAQFLHGGWSVPGYGLPWGLAGVKLWRGPMVPPPEPTPSEVDAVLGPRAAVHDAGDLDVTG